MIPLLEYLLVVRGAVLALEQQVESSLVAYLKL
jgi:hypothetical protein